MRLAIIFVLFIIISGCAIQEPISGGPKDEKGPRIVKSVPKNFSRNFQGNKILLVFDEYVELNQFNQELIVSPPLEYPVETKMRGKKLEIILEDSLKSETTYNFNFGLGIVDFTEKNPLDSNLFVLSTGEKMDSLEIWGWAVDSYTNNPIENLMVLLHHDTSDTSVYTNPPSYLSRTNAFGEFHFRYLREGRYAVYALEGGPGQNTYRGAGLIAYSDTLVSPGMDSLKLRVFPSPDTIHYISSTNPLSPYSFSIGIQKEPEGLEINALYRTDEDFYVVEEIEKDSLQFWLTVRPPNDTVAIHLMDTIGLDDTALVVLPELPEKPKRKKDKERKPIRFNPDLRSGVLDYFDTLRISLNRPFSAMNPDSIQFIIDKDTFELSEFLKDSILKVIEGRAGYGGEFEVRGLEVVYPWKQNTSYKFILFPGAFIDYYGETNDTDLIRFNTLSFEDYGSLRLVTNVVGYEGNKLIELLDKSGSSFTRYNFEDAAIIHSPLIAPMSLQVRLVLDKNGNGLWDTGDLQKGIQPERVYYYDEPIDVRVNWDLEMEWNVITDE
jgi:hypothetical protein